MERILQPGRKLISSLVNYGDWWRGLSTQRKILPAMCVFLIGAIFAALNGIRSDHVILGIFILVLFYGGMYGQIISKFLTPVFLVGVVYDSQKFYRDYIRGTIRVEEPYLFDKTIFGISTNKGILTPNEWLQLHTHWSLDFITGFIYLTFIPLVVFAMAWIYFYYGSRGTWRFNASELQKRVMQMMWAYFWVNCLGYSTYFWYPAAPPWYVAQYGFGPANLLVAPSAAGAVRFDQLLGTNFFGELYGRSQDVFGAVPSLHVAYPLTAVFFAFRFGASKLFKTLMILFYLLMCFGAVYLNHHYILDILWGTAYTFLVGWLVVWISEYRLKRKTVEQTSNAYG